MTRMFRAIDPLVHPPSPIARSSRTRRAFLRRSLLGAELFIGVAAVTGGVGLMINGLGMPQSTLAHAPFDQFTIPGLILMVVGGGLMAAGWMVWIRHRLASLASLAAGCILLGWIVVESVMVREGRALQAIVLFFALVILILAWLLVREHDRPNEWPA